MIVKWEYSEGRSSTYVLVAHIHTCSTWYVSKQATRGLEIQAEALCGAPPAGYAALITGADHIVPTRLEPS